MPPTQSDFAGAHPTRPATASVAAPSAMRGDCCMETDTKSAASTASGVRRTVAVVGNIGLMLTFGPSHKAITHQHIRSHRQTRERAEESLHMLVRLPSLLGQFLGPWIVRPVLSERDQRPSVEPTGAPIIFVLREELLQILDIAPL